MPLKFTWKSVLGVATIALGLVNQAISSHLFPASVTVILVAVGGGIVAFERIADAIDNHTSAIKEQTAAQNPQPPV